MDEIWIALLPAVITGIPGIVSLYFLFNRNKVEKGKTAADTTQASGNAAASFAQAAQLTASQNKELQEQVDALETKVNGQVDVSRKLTDRVRHLEWVLERCAIRIAYLMGGIGMLIRQITNLNEKPCWTPDDWDMYGDDKTNRGEP
jgi:hypothetical protein